MALREVLSDIYTWAWFSERHQYDFNGHLVRLPGGNTCIDPVQTDEATLSEIERIGVARIVLTNRNHVRAAETVRARTNAAVLIHPADADYARNQGVQIDGELQVGDRFGPLAAVDASGKSPGEVALHWAERRLLIVGDAIIGNPPGRCSLLPEKVMDDPAHLRASIGKLLDLDFDILIVGDGASILTGAKEQVRDLVATFPS